MFHFVMLLDYSYIRVAGNLTVIFVYFPIECISVAELFFVGVEQCSTR